MADTESKLFAYFAALPWVQRGLSVKQSTKKGRIVVSERSFNPGDLIVVERPLLSYGENNQSDLFMRLFGDDIGDFEDYETTIHLLCRYLECSMEIDKGVPLEILNISDDSTTRVETTTTLPLSVVDELVATPHNLTHELASFVTSRLQLYNMDRILALLGKDPTTKLVKIIDTLRTNQFEMNRANGAGLYLFASMFAHDCDPNAIFSTRKKKLLIHAMRPIKPGEEICISYIADYWPTKIRNDMLLNTKAFECECLTCQPKSKQGRPDKARAFKCPRCQTGVVSPCGLGDNLDDWQCTSCNSGVTQQEKECFEQQEQEISRVLNMKNCLDFIRPPSGDSVVLQSPIHYSHYQVYYTLQSTLEELLATNESPEDAVAIAELLIESCKRVLNENHPSIADYWGYIAEVKMHKGDLVGAADAANRAATIARITCGADSPTANQLSKQAMLFHALAQQYGITTSQGDDEVDENIE